MKVVAVLASTFAVLAAAAPNPNPQPNPSPWCTNAIGAACWTARRSFEAIENVVRSEAPDEIGAEDENVAYLAEAAFAHLLELASHAHASPADFLASTGVQARDISEVQRRAEAMPKGKRYCISIFGRSCWKVRRAAEDFLIEARGMDHPVLQPVARAAKDILETF